MVGRKIGRNEPCPCGSGKKYKKCHLVTPITTRAIRVAIEHFGKQEQESKRLMSKGIYVSHVKPVTFEGKKAWALGSSVWIDSNPNQTFHEFIVSVLIDTVGREWWVSQLHAAEGERHFVVRCFLAMEEWKRTHRDRADEVRPGVFALDPDGLTQYLLCLAYDIATLRNASNLPGDLIARLRHKDQYQGARYELALAAIFARIGCEIDFFGDEFKSVKHPEFVAHFQPTGTSVAVEAKSRHRVGVIHQTGDFDKAKAMRGDVSGLLKKALQQDPGDKPFMVFIDLNSPLDSAIDVMDKTWASDMRNVLDDHDVPTAEKPDPLTLLGITNFSYHYEEGEPRLGSGTLANSSRIRSPRC